MSTPPMTAVREVLGWLQANVQTVVDDLSGEAERLRQQIADGKQAMQADVARADGLTPILPALVPLIDAYRRAKSRFEALEGQTDLRATLAAQATLAEAAQALADAGDRHDEQAQAMEACSAWRAANGAALKQALETPDLESRSGAVQQAHADLEAAHDEVEQSLYTPDFVDALAGYATVEQHLRDFERELAADTAGEQAYEARKAGIADKVQAAQEQIEAHDEQLPDADIEALETAVEAYDEAAEERRWDEAIEALGRAEAAADELLRVGSLIDAYDAKVEEMEPLSERAREIVDGDEDDLLAPEVDAVREAEAAVQAAQDSLDWEAAFQKAVVYGERVQALIDASADAPAMEERARARAVEAYRTGRAELESGDLAQVPDQPPVPELAALHAAVVAARQALPADPQTQAEAERAQQALDETQEQVQAYLSAEQAALTQARAAFDPLRRRVNESARNLPGTAPSGMEPALAELQAALAEIPGKLERLSEAAALTARLTEIEPKLETFLDACREVRDRLQADLSQRRRDVRALGWGSLPRWAPKGAEAEHGHLMELNAREISSGRADGDPAAMQEAIALYDELKPALEAYNDRVAALMPQRRAELEAARAELYEGALDEVPAKPPAEGLTRRHEAVLSARRIFEKTPRKTLSDLDSALIELGRLRAAVEAYHNATPDVLAELVQGYRAQKAALEAGPLKQVPAKPGDDKELKEIHRFLQRTLKDLPDTPTTFDEEADGRRSIAIATRHANDYAKRARLVANWRKGMTDYGPTGTKRGDLEGLRDCNPRQLEMFDSVWKQELPSLDKTELTDEEMRARAEELAGWAAGLSKTKVEADFPGVNADIAKSATLTDNVVQLQARGWKIQTGKRGGGSYCQREHKCITLDPADSALPDVLAAIAHEAGHALFKPPEPPRASQMSDGLAYVLRGLESAFIDEGEAQMNACKVHHEMAKEKVGYRVAGGEEVFLDIYDRFLLGKLTVDAARIEMGRQFNNLKASGDGGKPYKRHYGEPLVKAWNDACRKSGRTPITVEALDTLIVFGPTQS